MKWILHTAIVKIMKVNFDALYTKFVKIDLIIEVVGLAKDGGGARTV